MTIICKKCGEAAGSTGSMAGIVHKWGPTDHDFEPVEAPIDDDFCTVDEMALEQAEAELLIRG